MQSSWTYLTNVKKYKNKIKVEFLIKGTIKPMGKIYWVLERVLIKNK
jgi:hypothetical protein